MSSSIDRDGLHLALFIRQPHSCSQCRGSSCAASAAGRTGWIWIINRLFTGKKVVVILLDRFESCLNVIFLVLAAFKGFEVKQRHDRFLVLAAGGRNSLPDRVPEQAICFFGSILVIFCFQVRLKLLYGGL